MVWRTNLDKPLTIKGNYRIFGYEHYQKTFQIPERKYSIYPYRFKPVDLYGAIVFKRGTGNPNPCNESDFYIKAGLGMAIFYLYVCT